MKNLTKEKIVEILGKHKHLIRITKAGDARMGLLTDDYDNIAAELLAFHEAEIAKWGELRETLEKLVALQASYGKVGDAMRLRQRISELEKELNLKSE